MTEQELRALVRQAIARSSASPTVQAAQVPSAVPVHLHASHGVFLLPTGADGAGPCLIEPAVLCSHCGYCQSYGH